MRTEAAALVVLALAALAGLGRRGLAAGAAAVVALALGEKARLHWLARRIGERELRATFQFAVLALVVLPVLPAARVGPLGGVNLRALWGVVRNWAGEVSFNLFSEGTEVLIRTGLFQWGSDMLSGIPGPTAAGVPVLLLLLAAAVPVSAWAMARLLRAPMTGMTHA